MLLLGFLVHRLQRALDSITDLDGQYPALRVSRPAWRENDEEEGEALLRSYLGRAFLLAGTIGDGFENRDGLPVWHARTALRLVDEFDGDPGQLFDNLLAKAPSATDCIGRGFVPESTAVAAAHIDATGGHGGVLVVVDVGGGTSDFGAFLTAPGNQHHGRIGEVVSVRRSLAKGGDELDRLLLQYLKRENAHDEGTPASQAPLARMRRRIRTMKEELFREGSLVGEFTGDLQRFLDEPAVRKFISEISAEFQIPFERACEYESRERPLKIVRTGGGASLRFILDLGCSKPSAGVPSWITNPLWQAQYPQLAVAIGAAMPQMPEQR